MRIDIRQQFHTRYQRRAFEDRAGGTNVNRLLDTVKLQLPANTRMCMQCLLMVAKLRRSPRSAVAGFVLGVNPSDPRCLLRVTPLYSVPQVLPEAPHGSVAAAAYVTMA